MTRIANINAICIPGLNLPTISQGKHPENKLSKQFARAFSNSMTTKGIGLREFECPGNGIADFVWVQFSKQRNNINSVEEIIAFEIKIENWKKGLAQAYRYGYFADKVYLVLPQGKVALACLSSALFKALGVGLYGYNDKTNILSQWIRAKDNGPRNGAIRVQAIKRLSRKLKLSFLTQ